MKKDIQSFAALYAYIKALPENDTFLNHRESRQWKTFSKTEFITAVRYLSLAFAAEGWQGRQIALAISPSVYWLMIDYALMLSGAVSVPLFTNISTRNLQFQIDDADLHTVFIQSEEQEQIILGADSTITCIDIDTTDSNRTSLDTFIKAGQKIDHNSPTRFDEILSKILPDDLITIVYTSGTSGLPKGQTSGPREIDP